MITLDKFILKKEEEIPEIERMELLKLTHKEESTEKFSEYFSKFHALKIRGITKKYFIYKKDNKKDPLGCFIIYAINEEARSAYTTLLIFSKHKFDVFEGTTTPIYGSIILHATLYLAEHEEELGFLLKEATSTIITLKKEGDLDTLLRYTRLRTCRKDIVLADPEYWIQEENGTYFLFMKHSYEKVIVNRHKYLK